MTLVLFVMPLFRVDFHGHCQGDPCDLYLTHTVYEHIDRAVEVGLDAIAITWHGRAFTHPRAMDYARERGLLLIPGMETNLRAKLHTLCLNVTPDCIPGASTLEDLKKFRGNPEVFVVAPHPYYPHGCCLRGLIDERPELFDGVEWCHLHVNWLRGRMNPNIRAKRWAQRHGKPLMAFSDAHFLPEIGQVFTEVEAEELSVEALFTAMRAGKVRFDPQAISLGLFARKVAEIIRYQFPVKPVPWRDDALTIPVESAQLEEERET